MLTPEMTSSPDNLTRTEMPVLISEKGCLVDATGKEHEINWGIKPNPDGSLEVYASVPPETRVARLTWTLSNDYPRSPDSRWLRFFGSDTCSILGIAPLEVQSRAKIKELRPDHNWVSSLGKTLPGEASHLVAAVYDSSKPSSSDTTLFGFLPDKNNRAEATFQITPEGKVEVSFWYDKTSGGSYKNNLVILKGNYREVVAEYAEKLRARLCLARKEPQSRENNLFLWPSLGKKFTLKDLVKNIEIASSLRKFDGIEGESLIDYLTVDDNLFDVQGDYKYSRFLNGSGFKTVREFVDWAAREKGVKIELWWSPFEAAVGSETVKKNPQLFVHRDDKLYHLPKGHNRSLLYGAKNPLDLIPDGICVFDIRREEVLNFLKARAKKMVTEFGITRFKFDYLHLSLTQPFLEENNGKTRIEIARRAIQTIIDGVKEGAAEIGRSDAVAVLLCQAPLMAFLGLDAPRLKVRFTDDLLPVPIWRIPTPEWTGLNSFLEKVHHKFPNPLFWWTQATRAMWRAPLIAGVCEPVVDGPVLEMPRYGIAPDISKSFILNSLAPKPWFKTLVVGNDLTELDPKGLLNVAKLLKAFKDGSWEELQEDLNQLSLQRSRDRLSSG